MMMPQRPSHYLPRSLLFALATIVPLRAAAAEIKLTALDAAPGDQFGTHVAIDGDVVVVSAPLADHLGADSGAVYVFRRIGGTWEEEMVLHPADTVAGDMVGESLAMSGDAILVGVPRKAVETGAAYVFRWNGVQWIEEQKLLGQDTLGGDHLGTSVSISGDVAIIGAGFDDFFNNPNAGSAYVFRRQGGVWVQEAKVDASPPSETDLFGLASAIDGDTAIVGAGLAGPKFLGGEAYVYRRNGSSWPLQQKLLPPDQANQDFFGRDAVAVAGDRVLVTSEAHDHPGANNGAAYVYRRVNNTWTFEQELLAADREAHDLFGHAAALGTDVAVIGAYQDDDPVIGANIGSVYVFRHDGVSWSQEEKIVASDGNVQDFLGNSVALAPDGLIVAGAPLHDAEGQDAGAVYLFGAVTNLPPIADAGADTNSLVGAVAQLDAAGSFDPEGQPLTYQWTLVTKPPTSASELSDPTAPNPMLLTDKPGTYVLDLMVNDGSLDSEPDSVVVTAHYPPEVTLYATQDSFLRSGSANRNEGANPRLRVQSSGKNRSMVGFDPDAIDTTGLTGARLLLTIAENGNNWGNGNDRTVDAHPLLGVFAEGNGKEVDVPNAEVTRGTGPGVTWKCAVDAEIANQATDCAETWDGGTFGGAMAPPVIHSNGLSGTIEWDVTTDVLSGSRAWLVKKTIEGQNGQASYYSREGAAAEADLDLGPRLVLLYAQNAQEAPAPAQELAAGAGSTPPVDADTDTTACSLDPHGGAGTGFGAAVLAFLLRRRRIQT